MCHASCNARFLLQNGKSEPYFDYSSEYVTKNTTKVDKFYVNEAIKLITESGKLAADKDFISLYTTNDEPQL